ncbi:MAG: hypothetical protein KDA86_13925 [Planctomycetaceae bacterium]|nr:hypothetical protein [Planctomycetaceae bacterium]MCA9110366.1 hypothetical protein [Planctomycetaceae bacterium]
MNPILALDIGSIFAVGFLLISFIGWIMNLINAQNPPPQPKQPARRPVPRDRKVQNEIEAFLQEAMGRRAPDQQQRPQVDEIEIIEPAPQRRRPPQPQPSRKKARKPATPSSSLPQPSSQPGESLSSRHLSSSPKLGQGVRSHADEHMRSRLADQIQQDLPHLVSQGVSQHLGEFRADDVDTRREVAPFVSSRAAVKDVTGLIASIRKPSEMRKAIILQEILSKPRVLQNRGDD